MKEAKMNNKKRNAYHKQKTNAKQRGISFKFTFVDWCAWWEERLGPDWFKMRGCRRGQYVMARYMDRGVYERGNVRAITASENIALYNKRRKPVNGFVSAMLPDEIVKAVYLDQSRYSEIAEKYEITKHRIQCIKQKHYYRKITDELD